MASGRWLTAHSCRGSPGLEPVFPFDPLAGNLSLGLSGIGRRGKGQIEKGPEISDPFKHQCAAAVSIGPLGFGTSQTIRAAATKQTAMIAKIWTVATITLCP